MTEGRYPHQLTGKIDQKSKTLLNFVCDNCGELNTIDKLVRLHDPDPNFFRNYPRYFYRYLYCIKCDNKFRLELLTTFSAEYANVINCGERTLEEINTQIFTLVQHKSGLLDLVDEGKFDNGLNGHDQEFYSNVSLETNSEETVNEEIIDDRQEEEIEFHFNDGNVNIDSVKDNIKVYSYENEIEVYSDDGFLKVDFEEEDINVTIDELSLIHI